MKNVLISLVIVFALASGTVNASSNSSKKKEPSKASPSRPLYNQPNSSRVRLYLHEVERHLGILNTRINNLKKDVREDGVIVDGINRYLRKIEKILSTQDVSSGRIDLGSRVQSYKNLVKDVEQRISNSEFLKKKTALGKSKLKRLERLKKRGQWKLARTRENLQLMEISLGNDVGFLKALDAVKNLDLLTNRGEDYDWTKIDRKFAKTLKEWDLKASAAKTYDDYLSCLFTFGSEEEVIPNWDEVEPEKDLLSKIRNALPKSEPKKKPEKKAEKKTESTPKKNGAKK